MLRILLIGKRKGRQHDDDFLFTVIECFECIAKKLRGEMVLFAAFAARKSSQDACFVQTPISSFVLQRCRKQKAACK